MTKAAASASAAAALLAAALAAVPPRARTANAAAWQPARSYAAGAFHVHTTRSDGRGSIDDVASAARRAGLDFVVLTDHGDGTRPPAPPTYRSGVLVIDAVEVSTFGGHYTALGMAPSPYPLAGDARDVVEDVARLGGFGIAAHGDSPKPDLMWANRDEMVDGVEWLNLESIWRRATTTQVVRASIGYWFRAPESLALALARPAALDWLDDLARDRPVVSIAATDAHGAVESSYEACFRTISTRVELAAPLEGDPARDAVVIVQALRLGRHYSVVDGLARGGAFELVGRVNTQVVRPGDVVGAGTPLVIEARTAAPDGAVLVVMRDGVVVRQSSTGAIAYDTGGQPGAYRAEVRLPSDGVDVPWIVSNAIAIRDAGAVVEIPREKASARLDLVVPREGDPAWHTEHDRSSRVTLERAGDTPGGLRLRFALGGGPASDQFAAIVLPVPADFARYDRLTLNAHATRPMRLAVQLRDLGNANPPRWRRSIYLDREPRDMSVPFSDMRPVPPNAAPTAQHARSGGLMLVVDTLHTPPGTDGEVVFDTLAFERGRHDQP